MVRARTIITACGFASIATIAVAQQPRVELKLETRTLEPGEAINVQLVCTNTGTPTTPEAAIPDGLDLKLLNPTPSTSSFTQIINGRISQRETYTFVLRLTALKEGIHTLGPITVVADEETYRTTPVRIVVRNTETAPVPKGDRYIFAELEVEPRSLYVTQTYAATLTFGIRKVEINGRIFNVDMLRHVLDARASQLSVFADGRARRSERSLTDSNGVQHRYEIFRVTKQIRAEEVGEALVGPVFLKANYPTRLRRGFFGGTEITQHRRETARADAITVEVKAPPVEGRPADYTGAIGEFTMTVTAKPTHVEQDQPITLTVSIDGTPLQGVAGPDLTKQPELASRFDYTKDEPLGDLEEGAKVFRRAIFPKQPGAQTVPPISWSFFDPHRETYVTLTSDPISITVILRTVTPTTITLLEEAERDAQSTSLTVLTGGISPNFVDPDAVLANQSFVLTAPWVASLIGSPLAWLVVTLATRYRARLKADTGFARRRRARRAARARISHALRNGEPTQQLHQLAEALTGYLSDRLDLPSGTLTPADVRSVLSTNDFEETFVSEIVNFLEACDTVRYAPGAMGTMSPLQAAANVRRWIRRIDRSKP